MTGAQTTVEDITLAVNGRPLSGLFAPGVRQVGEVPEVEKVASQLWPDYLREIAPAIRVPVRSIADHERWWVTGPEAMAFLEECILGRSLAS